MNAPSSILPVYRRSDIVMVRGEGCYLFDEAGKKYLDFATGIAVNALGHNHPQVTAALKAQADQLWHCSNQFCIPGLEKMAERITKLAGLDQAFFCSSGTEAVEAAVKIIRRYHYSRGDAKRTRIITLEGGFHGRTYAGISAGGNESAREGFAPLLPGFDRVAWNDLASVENAITSETAAVMLEPIQGEGGIRVAPMGYLKNLRVLCDKHGLLLFLDEVQCGMGRSGTLFAYEQAEIVPDLVTVAKGIGNGFPLAACLTNTKAGSGMTPGSHGSTYGGNPLAMAVGNAVLDVMTAPDFLPQVQVQGTRLRAKLEQLAAEFPHHILEVRGGGMMLGLKMAKPARPIMEELRSQGLLTVASAEDNVLRILPPLIITEAHIDEAISILCRTFST